MNDKDLGFFTRHVEKFIIAAGILMLGLILLIYVVGNPYAVDVNGRKLDAAALEAQIEETAQQLQTRVATYKEFPRKQVFPWAVNFQDRLEDSASSIGELAASVGQPGTGPEVNIVVGQLQPFDVPQPPLPINVVAYDSYGVFAPDAAGEQTLTDSQVQQVYQVIGNRAPADFAYVSLQGEFDMDEWLARLESPTAVNPVPRAFWRGKMAITAVYLQRQELDPLTREWSEPVIVDTLPSQIAYTHQFTRNYNDQEARAYIEFIKQSQERIARPSFLPLASHARPWLPPERFGRLTPEDHRELDKVNRTINRLEKLIQNITDNLQRMRERDTRATAQPRQPARTPATATPRSGPDDFGDIMGGGRGGAPGGGLAPAAPRTFSNTSREQEMQEQLQRSAEELQEARRKLNELLGVELDIVGANTNPMMLPGMMDNPMMYSPMMQGPGGLDPRMMMMPGYEMDPYARPGASPYGPTMPPGVRGAPAPRGARTPQETAPEEPVNRTVKVWAHDLTVERGKTYRYRLLVSVMNPLFREARVEEQQKAENFNRISIGPADEELNASPWTDPILVEPERDFFFTAGTAQQQFATVEVWRIYDGKPRSKEFVVHPGDPIGGDAAVDGMTIDMNVGAVLVDLISQSNRSGVGSSTRMLFIESDDEQIHSRSLDQDRDSDERLRLENERKIIEALTGGLAASAMLAP